MITVVYIAHYTYWLYAFGTKFLNYIFTKSTSIHFHVIFCSSGGAPVKQIHTLIRFIFSFQINIFRQSPEPVETYNKKLKYLFK